MAMHAALGKVIHSLNPYTDTMEFPQPPVAAAPTAGKTPPPQDVSQIQVEIDDYRGEWTFRGQMQNISVACASPTATRLLTIKASRPGCTPRSIC
jgi:hypothetical protein